MAKRKIPPHWERLLRGSALVLAVKVLGALSGYAFVFLLVREYGKEGYGSFELAFTILSLASALNRWGWDGIVVREVLARKGKKKKQNAVLTAAFSFVLATGLVLSAALYWGAPLLGKLFHSEQLPKHLSVVAVLLIPWGWFQLRSDVFRAKNNLLAYGLWQYGSLTLLASILLFLVPVDASVYSPVTLLLLVLLPFLAWNLWKLRASAASVSLQEQRAEWKLALPGATSMLVSSLLYLVLSWSDTLMIGYFLDESAVGLYRVSFKVATLIVFAQFAVNAQAAPDIARYRGGPAGFLGFNPGRPLVFGLFWRRLYRPGRHPPVAGAGSIDQRFVRSGDVPPEHDRSREVGPKHHGRRGGGESRRKCRVDSHRGHCWGGDCHELYHGPLERLGDGGGLPQNRHTNVSLLALIGA